MSNNEIVYSIINDRPSLVVHADDAEVLSHFVADLDNDLLNDLDDLAARFGSPAKRGAVGMSSARYLVEQELGGTPVHDEPENAPVRHTEAPVATAVNDLPEGVRIYVGPQADNPDYNDLFIDGISFKMKEGLAKAVQQTGHKFRSGKSSFIKFNGKDKPYTTVTQNEPLVRWFISENAHLQDAK